MKNNPGQTGGAVASGTATEQRQETDTSTPPGAQFVRRPQLGMNVLYRPKSGGQFIAFIFGVRPDTALERRVDLIYTDQTGQRHELLNRAYGDQPDCWEYNTALEQEQARILASHLMQWGVLVLQHQPGSVSDPAQQQRTGPGESGITARNE